jgi:hypothetical protein
MEMCDWCEDEIERMSFNGSISGLEVTMCHDCYHRLMNNQLEKLADKRKWQNSNSL